MLEHEGVFQAGGGSSQADEGSNGTSAPQSKLVVLPDSPDTRLLVDLTSHVNDLSEAAHSLGRALDSGEGSEIWEPLASHAVTAYIRPFLHSNVRVRLDQRRGVQDQQHRGRAASCDGASKGGGPNSRGGAVQ